MQYSIDDHCRLVLKLDREDKHILTSECQDRQAELDYIEDALHEQLICNAQFEFISPAVCMDLTDADMIGILGEDQPHDGPAYGGGSATEGIGSGWVRTSSRTAAPVIARWAYMRYAVRDWREEIITTGECIWEGGFVDRENDPAALRCLLCLKTTVEN